MFKLKHTLLFAMIVTASICFVSCLAWHDSSVTAKNSSYKFVLLSDTHYDDALYHPDKKNYSTPRIEMWKGKMQTLIHAAASKADKDTKFVLHAGDLAEDDRAATSELSLQMLREAVKFLKSEFTSVPLIPVPGNHDKNHKNFFAEYLSSEMKQKITNTTFSFMEGPDLFLCIDSNDPDLNIIRKALAEHADARYKFVMVHAPVIPTDVWESCLFENRPEERKEFRELFLKHDIIALSGHVHSLEYVRCESDSGRITQLITSSLWMPQVGLDPQIWVGGTENYMKLNPNLSSHARKLLFEYKDIVKEYKAAAAKNSTSAKPDIQTSGAGYYILNVNSDGVTADFYRGNTTERPEWTLRLR